MIVEGEIGMVFSTSYSLFDHGQAYDSAVLNLSSRPGARDETWEIPECSILKI